jgi:hypothetical protein
MSPVSFQSGVIRPIQCFREGWELIKERYWLFFGISLVGVLLSGFSLNLLMGAMFCGTYYCLIQQQNGQPPSFGDLFKGFDYFVPGLIASLFFIIPNLVITFMNFGIQLIFPVIFKETGGSTQALWTFFGVYIAIVAVLGIFLACIHALMMFAFPLIVEFKLSGIDAFKTSARAVWANLGGVIGLIVCEYALFILGLLACYFGMLFVVPLMFAGTFIAYRKVFPQLQSTGQNFNSPPPPPNFNPPQPPAFVNPNQ